MSSLGDELSLGSELSSRLLSKLRNVAKKSCNLEEHIKKLEEEKIKIKDYELELPFCLETLNDAISFLRDENKKCLEMNVKPLLKDLNEEWRERDGIDKKNKNSLSSSIQLWKGNDQSSINRFLDKNITHKPEIKIKQGKSVNGFSKFSPGLDLGLRLTSSSMMNGERRDIITSYKTTTNSVTSSSMVNGGRRDITSNGSTSNSIISVSNPSIRKQRRSWTSELHNRFLNALEKLGGSGVATPKQIRELMQEEGLTNDEVKSHLQKYRLHMRKPCANSGKRSVNVLGFSLWNSQEEEVSGESAKRRRRSSSDQSDSPQGPLQLTTTTGGDSMEDEEGEDIEDVKSERFDELWRD